jgi:hypothetical protein
MVAMWAVSFTLPLAVTQPASAVQVDQCVQPLSERVGGWACAEPATEVQRKAGLQQLAKAGAITQKEATTAAGWCRPNGCWTPFSQTQAAFTGGGPYGYGKTPLGTAHLNFTVNTSGHQTLSKPFSAYTTRGTKSTTLKAERLYLSARFPGGNSVSGGATRRTSPCGARNGSQSCLWGGSFSSAYASFEPTAAHISVVHEVSWTDSSSAFPGRWHFYAKSATMDRTGVGYRFLRGGQSLAGLPVHGGWSPS